MLGDPSLLGDDVHPDFVIRDQAVKSLHDIDDVGRQGAVGICNDIKRTMRALMEIKPGPRRQGLRDITRQLQVTRIQFQFEIFAGVIR